MEPGSRCLAPARIRGPARPDPPAANLNLWRRVAQVGANGDVSLHAQCQIVGCEGYMANAIEGTLAMWDSGIHDCYSTAAYAIQFMNFADVAFHRVTIAACTGVRMPI